MRAQPRRDLWEVAQSVPEGNTLILLDLLAPREQRAAILRRAGRTLRPCASTRPPAKRLARASSRKRWNGSNVKADARVVDELARSSAELAAVRNDLEKLALAGKKITLKDLRARSACRSKTRKHTDMRARSPKGESTTRSRSRTSFSPTSRAMRQCPLLSALATECLCLWELSRSGGELPARSRWRERVLRPIAQRVGERRARVAYERARSRRRSDRYWPRRK